MINTMAADGLVTQGARASATMILTYFCWNIVAQAPEGLRELTHCGLLKPCCYIDLGQHWFKEWLGAINKPFLEPVEPEVGFIISEVLWHLPQGNFTGNAQDVYA